MTKEVLIAQLSKYNWDATNIEIAIRAKCECEYCGKNMLESIDNYKLWQIDHIIPRCSGETFCEDFDNKALSCAQCNKDFKAKWNPKYSTEERLNREQYIERIKTYVENKRIEKSKELDEINKLFGSYFTSDTNPLTQVSRS